MEDDKIRWVSNVGMNLIAGYTTIVGGNVTGCIKNINGKLVPCIMCANCLPGYSKKEYEAYYETLKMEHIPQNRNGYRNLIDAQNNIHNNSMNEETRKRKNPFNKKQQNVNYKVPKNDKTYR